MLIGDKVVVSDAAGRRVVRRNGTLHGLAVDDDRTIRWRTGVDFRLLDLPRPVSPGFCPRRAGFAPVAETPLMRVTQREYTDVEGHYGTAVRACEAATGLDRVVRTASNWLDGGETLEAVGASGPWVVMTSALTNDKHDDTCARQVIVRHAVAAIEHRRPAPCTTADGVPRRGEALVVTDAGAVAWVEQRPEGARLLALTPGGARVLDDRAAAAITDLRSEGDRVLWRRDGVDRDATL